MFRRAFAHLRDFLAPDVLRALPKLAPHRSLDGELRRYFRDPRTRLAFSFQSKYLGMSPFRCPSLFSIISALEYDFGVYHPRGGCGAVMAAMARVARRMGVCIRTGEPVRRILLDGQRAVGVETARARIAADAVVLNADFAHAVSTLVPDAARRRWTDARLARNQMLHRRPHNRFEDLDGVYLVGGGTHPGSGLPVIFQSARISADLLACDLDLAPRMVPATAMAAE